MKGQVNIDYAIAVGVFIAGVTTAITLTISSVQPMDTGYTASLQSQVSSVSTSFSDEVSWSVDEKNIYYEKNGFDQPILSVNGVESGRDYTVVSGNLTGSDTFDDRVVFTTSTNHSRVLGSDSDLESSDQTETFSISSSSFSNNVIDVDFSDSGIDQYNFENTRLIEGISTEDSVDSVADGSVSGRVDYGDQQVFFYGGDMPEFYLRSINSNSTVTVASELETAEVIETGNTYDLSTSNSFSGSGPVIFYNSSMGVGVTGPGTEFSVSSGSGTTEVEVLGSYYVYGFDDVSNGTSRAETRIEFPRTATNQVEGVNNTQAEDLFDESDTIFRNRLGLSSGFNVEFDGMQKGEFPPMDQTVVSQSFDKQILMINGSTRSEDLEVQLWQ